MDKIPINPKVREAFNKMKNEMGKELNIDKGKLPSRLFSYYRKDIDKIKK
ncbi:hypothetical protein [Crassaminicella indica]|uniref:Uncharacterized protein n=1 Tax=Crassaminicella indica TaxID=2855394 RepID=A0ABX8RGZ1_9CLOT|nr:hypothetical protein [Crassaminicella indica]QXM06216.1 hypothetical protein KVH43_12855 [Crassaminicella indica]